MKKHLAKIFGGIFAVALLATGCATVSSVKNTSKEMIYNGGSAVSVGDFTYFANGYTPYSSATSFDYKGSAKVSYLARINNQTLQAENKDFSPSVVEKVREKVAGFQNQDMFVLGDYIYFTSANELEYGKPRAHDYSLVSLWRCRLNGDNLKRIYTTEYFTGGKFAPVGDAQNGYYWICFTGAYDSSKEFSGQIFSIKLDSNLQTKKIAEKVLSCAFANVKEDGNLDRVFYTATITENNTTSNKTFSIDYAGKKADEYQTNATVTFVDKLEDRVFFANEANTYTIFYRDVAAIAENDNFENSNFAFTAASSEDISNIWRVCADDQTSSYRGYIYHVSDGALMYVKESLMGQSNEIPPYAEPIVSAENLTDVLFVEDDEANCYVYYSNSTTISRISIKPAANGDKSQPETLVTMTSLQSGQYGFDGEYVYFFAKLEDVETKEENLDADDNMYMYRIKKDGRGDYQLIAKTQQTRTPKEEA